MCTREICHEVPVTASPRKLYKAVTDVKKLAHWWTTDTRGISEVGKTLEFWFGGSRASAVMEVTALKPHELFLRQVVDGSAKECIGTELEFKILRDEGKTLLHFRHSRWREDAKMFPKCSMDWAVYLLSLKELVERGKGCPYPDDVLPHA